MKAKAHEGFRDPKAWAHPDAHVFAPLLLMTSPSLTFTSSPTVGEPQVSVALGVKPILAPSVVKNCIQLPHFKTIKMGGGNESAKINRLLPVPNSTASYWRSEPHRLDECRSTEQLPSQADIVIIGTGIAGVSTAYHLLKRKVNDNAPQPSILLLEARQVCSGATGRNGGHIKKLPSTIVELIQNHGSTAAGEIVKFVRANIYGVKNVIEKEKIQAEAELRRSFDVSLEKEDAREVKKDFEVQLQSEFPLVEDVGYVGEEFAERLRIDPTEVTCW